MAKAKKKPEDQAAAIEIEGVSTLEINVAILGTTPFLCNRLSEKARHELLMPAPPKNKAERAMRLKHQPYDEYRASIYRSLDEEAPTRILTPGAAFRKAIAAAALDIPGATKTQIGRLVRAVEYNVHVYGIPKLSCMIIRVNNRDRTPDVRTRAILPEWACHVTLRFPHPLLKERAVLTLLAAAGDFVGVGDGRNEKGSLSFGCFTPIDPANSDFLRICAAGGRAAQDAALADPVPYDEETRELLGWFDVEVQRRDQAATTRGNGRKAREEVGA